MTRTQAYDPKYISNAEIRSTGRAVRPRDAATLILVRRDGPAPRILMGKRSAGHAFMPNKFVFPGGRVDPGDGRLRPGRDLHPLVLERLTRHCSPTRARALAMAAIRETYEETGLLLGESAGQTLRTRSPHWRPFVDRGVTPTLDTLHFIARAITPPYRRKRFDARFFMADADLVHGEVHARPAGSGELLELHWVTPEEAQALELPNITRMVIDEVARRLREGHGPGDEGPFVRFARGKPVVERV